VNTLLDQSAAAQSATGLSARQLCQQLTFSRATLGRWRGRQRGGQPLLRPPGPAKTEPLPLELLQAQIGELPHGRQRTVGTGALYQQHCFHISRRHLGRLVEEARHEYRQAIRLQLRHLDWQAVQVVWALDATEWRTTPTGSKLQVLAGSDLASRYGLDLRAHQHLSGKVVADYLAAQIHRHGAPLFLKRDNGSVLRAPEVRAVLAQAGVLPLDSPTFYAPYNGAIERYIGQVKHTLPGDLAWPCQDDLGFPQASLDGVRHQLNAQPRSILGGASPAEVFHRGPRLRFTRPERTELFHLLLGHTRRKLSSMESVNQANLDAAWRHSVEHWLIAQGLVVVNHHPQTNHQTTTNKTIVLPHSSKKWSH